MRPSAVAVQAAVCSRFFRPVLAVVAVLSPRLVVFARRVVLDAILDFVVRRTRAGFSRSAPMLQCAAGFLAGFATVWVEVLLWSSSGLSKAIPPFVAFIIYVLQVSVLAPDCVGKDSRAITTPILLNVSLAEREPLRILWRLGWWRPLRPVRITRP